MMRGILLVLILAGNFFAGRSSLIVQSYKVSFVIENAGLDVDGSFASMTADITFNPDDLNNASISASVDVSSVKTGIDLRDKHLLGREYFNAEKFPAIKLQSKNIRATAKNRYAGTFILTIRGISKEVEIPFTAGKKGQNLVMKADFPVNRLDYGVGTKSIILSETVNVHLEVVAQTGR